MKRLLFSLLAVSACASAGCASTSAKPAFRDTARLVEARMAGPSRALVWDQDADADRQVKRSVRDLLARELTVDAAVQVALLNNRDLQATFEDLQIAQADLVQAGLLQNPVFGASVAFPVAGDASRGFGLSITDDFIGLFTMAARKRIAASELEGAKMRVADGVLRVAFVTKEAFFRFEAATQVAAMRRTIAAAGDAALDVATRLKEAGNISELDLANQESLREDAGADLLRSEADVLTAREALTRAMGLWGADAEYRIAPKLPELPAKEPPLDAAADVALVRRLDLGAARAKSESLARALDLAKSSRWFGSVSVGADFERAPEGFSVLGPTAGLELPIFDQKQAAIARLEGQLRAARAREAALAVGIRSEVREACGRALATRAIVKRYAEVIVPLRERVLALAQQQYDAMLLGVFPLIVAKQSETNAYREFIEALRDYWIARAALERAAAGPLPLSPAPVSAGAPARVSAPVSAASRTPS
jgi:cobalt-zinc-cadmium efflux system outer membrane protein